MKANMNSAPIVEKLLLCGDLEKIEEGGELLGWRIGRKRSTIRFSDIPSHFIAFELNADRNLRPKPILHGDVEALERFMAEWGLLFHPVRQLIAKDVRGGDMVDYRAAVALAVASNLESDWIRDACRSVEDSAELCRRFDLMPSEAVSCEEAWGALLWLQDFWSKFCSDGLTSLETAVFNANLTTCEELQVDFLSNKRYVAAVSVPSMSLTEAICTQLFELIKDGREWDTCDKCGRLFKYKRLRGGKYSQTRKHAADYCCHACQNAAGNQRHREKEKGE